jgi:hypothetical protein
MEGSRTDLLRWLSTTTNPANCAPSIVSIAAPAFQAAYDQGSGGHIKKWDRGATIDHPFEKHWLMGFFEYIIDPNAPSLSTLGERYVARKINCADLHNYGFGPQRTRNGIGDIFNAMPGGDANFLSLAGMARGINQGSKVMCPYHLTFEMDVAHPATQ